MSQVRRLLHRVPKRRVVFLVAGLAAASATLLPATAASASGAPSSPTVRSTDPQSTDNLSPATLATMRRQEELQPALQAIWDEQTKTPDSGFAGVAFEGDGLSLYWKGPLTPGMTNAVGRARRTGPVTIKAATFSAAELQAQGAKIHSAIGRRGTSDIQQIGYEPDGGALDVVRQPASVMGPMRAARALAGKPTPATAEQILSDAAVTVPVHLSTAAAPVTTMSRVDDSSPWNGGDEWEDWHGNSETSPRARCTTGFGVNSGGHSWVLTAAHCGSVGDTAFQGSFSSGVWHQMGPINSDQWAYDLLLIDAPGWYVIFDGSPTTNTTKGVKGWGNWAANELVCQSGMTSGTICNIKQQKSTDIVVSQKSPDSDGDSGYTIHGLIQSVQIDGKTAVRPGDSGGPVFTLYGTGVRAKGITSAGEGSQFFFQDWADVIRLFGAYPNVSSSLG